MCDDGMIRFRRVGQETFHILAKDFRTEYQVDGKAISSVSKGASLAESHLVYINNKDELVSFSLAGLSEPDTIAGQQSFKVDRYIRFEGAVVDFCYAGKKKHLFVLTSDGSVHKLKFNANKVNYPPAKSLNLIEQADTAKPRSTHFTSIVSGRDELVLTGFNPSTSSQEFLLLSQDLTLLDKVIVGDQISHIHCLRQVIRHQISYYVASSRNSNLHIFKVENDSLIACNLDVRVTDGPIDGLCILNEDEIIVYSGDVDSPFARRVRFR